MLTESSRDRIIKTISHKQPQIVPINLEGIYDEKKWYKRFNTSDKIELREKLDLDIQSVRPVYTGPQSIKGLSIWGTPLSDIYGAEGAGYGVGREYPLCNAQNKDDIDKYCWPDARDFNYSIMSEAIMAIPSDRAVRIDGKYGIAENGIVLLKETQSGPWVPLICTLFDLFGMEKTLTNLYLNPSVIKYAVGYIEEFILLFYTKMLEASSGYAEIAYFGDDFATQKGMILSPQQWREFFLPTYKKLFSLIKQKGLFVWMHSCGSLVDVLGDLIDAGLDIWETVQVQAKGNDPVFLKTEFGRHLTFYGGISTQYTLPFGSEKDVRKEVRERIAVLGKNGGYICGADHGIMPDVPIDNVIAMFDEARKYIF
ncbi:MAG: hypothetical protein M1365_16275 [Actinobacteria bacterium]|nr:hypothetical protein [Actinomycetota bacterium]